MAHDLFPQNPELKISQHFPIASFFFDPLFVNTLPSSQRQLFAYMNFRAWQKRDLRIRCSVPFLAINIGSSNRTINRCLSALVELDLIRCVKIDLKKGNHYFVEPLLIGEFYWKRIPLRHLEQSHLFKQRQIGATEIMEKWPVLIEQRQIGATTTPKWRCIDYLARTQQRQIGAEIYYFRSLLLRDVARCHGNNYTPESGEDKIEAAGGLGQRSPNGQNYRGNGKKGISLSADRIEKNRDKMKAQARAMAEKENQEVVEREKSNFHSNHEKLIETVTIA